MVKIFIDPGHGGSDPGAVANGLKEKDLTLAISKKIKDKLANYENVQVKLSREGDQSLSLTQRTNMANSWGADYLISVHINAGGGTGFESYTYNGNYSGKQETNRKRSILHAEIMRQLSGVRNRGMKESNLHMVRESKMESVLTENLFIDNASDATLLKQDNFLDKIAQGHVNGLAVIFGLKQKTPQQKKISFYTGGYSGANLIKIHNFLLANGWWFTPERMVNGSIAFLVGEFTEGTEKANKMEQFLRQNNFWYEVR